MWFVVSVKIKTFYAVRDILIWKNKQY